MPQLPSPDPRSADSRPNRRVQPRIRQDLGHLCRFRERAAAKGDLAPSQAGPVGTGSKGVNLAAWIHNLTPETRRGPSAAYEFPINESVSVTFPLASAVALPKVCH